MAQAGAEAASLYSYSVTSYGDPLALHNSPPALDAAFLIGALMSTVVQVRQELVPSSCCDRAHFRISALLCVSNISILHVALHSSFPVRVSDF